MEGALNLLQLLAPMFFREEGNAKVPDLGLHFSPMNIKVTKYYEQYLSLQEFLRRGGVDSCQQITNNR